MRANLLLSLVITAGIVVAVIGVRSTDVLADKLTIVMAVYGAAGVAIAWGTWWSARNVPLMAVKAAGDAAALAALRGQQFDLLIALMRHVFDYAAAWESLQIALPTRTSTITAEGIAAEEMIMRAQSEFTKARGALVIDMQMLDFLFDEEKHETLAGLKVQMQRFYIQQPIDQHQDPTPDRAAALCGVIRDFARRQGFTV